MAKQEGRKVVAQNKKARHDYHIEDTYEAGLVLHGTEVKSLRAGRASLVDGFAEIAPRRGLAARRPHPRVHPGHLDQPRAAAGAQAAAQPRRRSTRSSAASTSGGSRSSRSSLYFKDGRAKVEIALARGQEVLRQAARARRAAGQPREASRRSADALKGMSRLTASSSADEDVPPGGSGWACPGCSTCTCTSCRRSIQAQGVGAVRRRRPADRSRVADPLPRRPTRSGSSQLRALRRTPLLGAALRAQPGHRGVPQRLGARTSPTQVPEALRSRDLLPRAGGGGVRRGAGRRGRRGVQGARPGGRLPASTTRCSTTAGARSPTPARRSSSTPAPGRSATRTPGPRRCAAVLERHPRLTAVVAHLGAPEYAEFLDLAERLRAGAPRHHDGVHRLLRGGGAVPARAAAAAARPAGQGAARHRLPDHPLPLRPPARGARSGSTSATTGCAASAGTTRPRSSQNRRVNVSCPLWATRGNPPERPQNNGRLAVHLGDM